MNKEPLPHLKVLELYPGQHKKIKTFDGKGTVFQAPDGTLYLYKRVKFSMSKDKLGHFHINKMAWGFGTDVIQECLKLGVTEIYLEVTGEEWNGPPVITASMQTLMDKSILDQHGDFEEQRFLHDSCWNPV